MLKPEAIGTTDALKALKMGEGMTPGEFFKTFDENRQLLPKFNQELSKDLEDTVDFYRLSFPAVACGRDEKHLVQRQGRIALGCPCSSWALIFSAPAVAPQITPGGSFLS